MRKPAALALILSVSLLTVLSTAGPDAIGAPDTGATVSGETGGKLESALRQLAEAYREQGQTGATSLAKQMAVDRVDEMVRVILEAAPGAVGDARATAESLGGKVEATDNDLLQVLLPVAALEQVSRSRSVGLVRRPLKPVPSETVSEGVGLVGANLWQAAGIEGTGVKIGIIDGGFAGFQKLLGTELPASLNYLSLRADRDITSGGDIHGTAVAEVIHDVAPRASLYLANFDTDVEFANAVDWMISQRVDIISVSIVWFASGPGDGTGVINEAVNRATAKGILWINAAGNSARHHWSGRFKDDDANGLHEFSGAYEANAVVAEASSLIAAWLRWDDPWKASTNDYDLYLYDASMNVVAKSENAQGRGYYYPYEALCFTAPAKGRYYLAIKKSSATRTAKLDLFVSHFLQPLGYNVVAGSVTEPGDNPNVLTVGAVNWRAPASIETYSSQGPTTDGRMKPDVAGLTKTTTVSYPGGFSGTSGATPHVAGAAALVKQAYPSFNAAQVKNFLAMRALDLGAPGRDNVFGWGRLSLGTPPVLPTPTPTATPSRTPTPGPGPTRTPTPGLRLVLPQLLKGVQ